MIQTFIKIKYFNTEFSELWTSYPIVPKIYECKGNEELTSLLQEKNQNTRRKMEYKQIIHTGIV